ncbi:DUF397 domain-containing protein [Streptomyces noursei]|uniref:DUF397 domain-containing protein n=1 Tax=Streptomyces noursei TaxID=1971 RepID=UPI00344D5B85
MPSNAAELHGIRWRKSSYSGDNYGQCVEVGEAAWPRAAQGAYGWHKSSRSVDKTDCVEAGRFAAGGVAVRDTKHNGAGAVLGFTGGAWTSFLGAVVEGRIGAV